MVSDRTSYLPGYLPRPEDSDPHTDSGEPEYMKDLPTYGNKEVTKIWVLTNFKF